MSKILRKVFYSKKKKVIPQYNNETFPFPSMNKYPQDLQKETPKNPPKNKHSYLNIFLRPSFHRLSNNPSLEYQSKTPNIPEQESENEKQSKYDYPVNIIKRFLYTWAKKIISIANNKPKLEISDLGKFSPDLYPDKFLSQIKPIWEKVSKTTKNSPLIKALLLQNTWMIILIFIGNLFVCSSETLNVLLYRHVILNLDNTTEKEPLLSLLTTIILLLINKFIYNFIFRLYETITVSNSYRIITQLYALIYDKLLRTSLYANVSEVSVKNFIQIDAENFGEFFTYTPGAMVLSFQIMFFMYLLFYYLGFCFLFSLASLLAILILSNYLQKMRTKYRKLVIEKKARRMKTTTQAFKIIKIVKLYSWEKYFIKKITEERNEELKYYKKLNMINAFINSLYWSTEPIMSFVSIWAYDYFNEKMNLSNVLTGLFIFHTLADPLFLLPEYINGLKDTLLSLKRIEIFLNKKEYNPTEIIKNIIPNNEKYAIEINGLDFGIIKKKGEFEKGDEEIENNNFNLNNKNNKNKFEIEGAEEIELQDLELDKNSKSEDNTYDNKEEKLLTNNYYFKENNDIKINIKEISKSESISEIEIIELLKRIDLKIEKGNLIGIVGPIGSGKTCLLNAILNNLDVLNNPTSQKIKINGTIAYVPQKSWIFNDTIRNNIIFKRPFNPEKYKIIINICRLIPDFDLFKNGDMTLINDKGENLSESQKTRINIARAVYSDSDIYLFDDPLSSLDSHVGDSIFNDLIKKYLKNKTILIATQSLQYIPFMNKVIYIDNGKIISYGKPEDTMNLPFLKNALTPQERRKYSEISTKQKFTKDKIISEYEDTEQEIMASDAMINHIKSSSQYHKYKKKENLNSYKEPSRFQSYKLIFSYCGGDFFIFSILFLCFLWRMADSMSDFIITKWSSLSDEVKPKNNYFNIYLITKLLGIIFIFVRSYIVINGLVNFNKSMHETLLLRLMRAPINLFHDIVNKSHILNRFSKDLDDSTKFFHSFNYALTLLFDSLSAIIISVIFNWKCIFIIPFIIFVQNYLYNYYKICSKKLFNLESFTRLSILSCFSETLTGLSSIRCYYDYAEKFRKDYHQKLHNFYRVLIYQNGSLSWFALNIDLVGFCYLFFIFVVIYLMRNTASPGTIGVLLYYVLKLVKKNFYFYEQYYQNERMSKSLESCQAYTQIVQEAPLVLKTDTILIRYNFPRTGKIEFKNFSVRYRPETELILKNLSFIIKSGEKIGVVGKTGSGKSNLTLCLFRILEPTYGTILIDNVDITKIGLSLLRQIITIIPQDPTLIEGTLRENLDPAGKFNDEEMIFNMNLIGLAYLMEEKGLDFEIKEYGKNLSVGERQLICMVRAILRKSKIIVMDEATSNIDYNTEKLIQKTILKILRGSTIITIAHRINTILDYDKIFVLDKGELIEEGTPRQLIDKKGNFYQLYTKAHT
jgi:ABC-type multidrug transport system fused ATPase/permease subunit